QYRAWRCAIGSLAPGAAAPVSARGWQRWRQADEEQERPGSAAPAGALGTARASVLPASRSASIAPWSDESDLLFARAGSLLLGTGGRSEVVLVARVPGPADFG